jgi:arginine/serine-rich splicing factor 12
MEFEITTTKTRDAGGLVPGRPGAAPPIVVAPSSTAAGRSVPGGSSSAPFGTDGGDLATATAPKMAVAATPETIARSVYVDGVSPSVTDDTLREFLQCCGALSSLTPTGGGAAMATAVGDAVSRQYVAVYEDAAAAKSALVLNNMTLVDRVISVSTTPGGARTAPGGASYQPSREQLLQAQQVAMAQQAVMEDPIALLKQAAAKLPEWLPKGFKRCALFVPIPHMIACARAAAEAHVEYREEREKQGGAEDTSDVARTVYAGNVNSSITEDMLADFFSVAGVVTYVKFAGSDFNPSRFGFVEFTDKASAEAAKALSGTMLAEMTLKVKHSNNPIIKDKLKNVWGTAGADRRRERKRTKRAREKRRRARDPSPSSSSSSFSSSDSSSSSSSTGSETRRRRKKRKEERDAKRNSARKEGKREKVEGPGEEDAGGGGGGGAGKDEKEGRGEIEGKEKDLDAKKRADGDGDEKKSSSRKRKDRKDRNSHRRDRKEDRNDRKDRKKDRRDEKRGEKDEKDDDGKDTRRKSSRGSSRGEWAEEKKKAEDGGGGGGDE